MASLVGGVNYVCNYCGISNSQKKLKACAACKSVKYCSPECQKKHWKAHKKACKMMRKGRKEVRRSEGFNRHKIEAICNEFCREKYPLSLGFAMSLAWKYRDYDVIIEIGDYNRVKLAENGELQIHECNPETSSMVRVVPRAEWEKRIKEDIKYSPSKTSSYSQYRERFKQADYDKNRVWFVDYRIVEMEDGGGGGFQPRYRLDRGYGPEWYMSHDKRLAASEYDKDLQPWFQEEARRMKDHYGIYVNSVIDDPLRYWATAFVASEVINGSRNKQTEDDITFGVSDILKQGAPYNYLTGLHNLTTANGKKELMKKGDWDTKIKELENFFPELGNPDVALTREEEEEEEDFFQPTDEMMAAMNTLMMRMENNDPSLFEDGDNRKKSDAPSPGRSKKRIEEDEWIASSSSSPLQFSMGKTTTATKSKKKKKKRRSKKNR